MSVNNIFLKEKNLQKINLEGTQDFWSLKEKKEKKLIELKIWIVEIKARK